MAGIHVQAKRCIASPAVAGGSGGGGGGGKDPMFHQIMVTGGSGDKIHSQ